MIPIRFLPLAVSLCIFFVASSASLQDVEVFQRALGSLSHAVRNYDSDFDGSVHVADLQTSIDMVDNELLGYQGRAKNHLDNTRRLNSHSGLTYKRSRDLAYEWCVSLKSSLNIFLRNMNVTMSDGDRNQIWKIAVGAVKQGLVKIGDSIETLNEVKKLRGELQQNLYAMQTDLEFDLGPRGFFETDTQNRILKDEELERNLGRQLTTSIDGRFASAAVKCLRTTFMDLKESRKSDLIKTKTTFRTLDKKIKTTAQLAGITDFGLEDDKTNINALKQRIFAEESIKKVIFEHQLDLQSQLIPFLETLGDDCSKYEAKISRTHY